MTPLPLRLTTMSRFRRTTLRLPMQTSSRLSSIRGASGILHFERNRQDVVFVTKCGLTWVSWAGGAGHPVWAHPGGELPRHKGEKQLFSHPQLPFYSIPASKADIDFTARDCWTWPARLWPTRSKVGRSSILYLINSSKTGKSVEELKDTFNFNNLTLVDDPVTLEDQVAKAYYDFFLSAIWTNLYLYFLYSFSLVFSSLPLFLL